MSYIVRMDDDYNTTDLLVELVTYTGGLSTVRLAPTSAALLVKQSTDPKVFNSILLYGTLIITNNISAKYIHHRNRRTTLSARLYISSSRSLARRNALLLEKGSSILWHLFRIPPAQYSLFLRSRAV